MLKLIDKQWDSEIEPVYNGPHGMLTAAQCYRRFGKSKLARGEAIGTEFESRTHCGQIIKVDDRGAAYCPVCHKIFNSGNTRDKDRPINTTKFKEAGPPPKRLLPRRWANAGRATSAAPDVYRIGVHHNANSTFQSSIFPHSSGHILLVAG